MEFHVTPIFLYFSLMLVATHAALSPEVYWKSMLPSTPMPKAITKLLNRGRKGEPVINDQHARMVKWGQNDAKEPEFPLYHHGNADHASNEPERRMGEPVINDQHAHIVKWGQNDAKEPEFPLYHHVKWGQNDAKEPEFPLYHDLKWGQNDAKEPEFPLYHRDNAEHAPEELEQHSHYGNANTKHALKKTQYQPKEDIFFFEEDIHPGTKLNMQFSKSKYAAPLFPRQIFESIPFSKDKMEELLNKLSLKPNSGEAEIIKRAITHCEAPPVGGEEKKCPASLESMVDFVISKFGKNVHAISSELENDIELQKISIKEGVKKLEDDKAIVCHRLNVPYVAFLCHKITKTSIYFVPLEAEDGARVKETVICHKDTSKWNPDHLAFEVLNVKPGTTSVCHFSYENTVVWLSK